MHAKSYLDLAKPYFTYIEFAREEVHAVITIISLRLSAYTPQTDLMLFFRCCKKLTVTYACSSSVCSLASSSESTVVINSTVTYYILGHCSLLFFPLISYVLSYFKSMYILIIIIIIIITIPGARAHLELDVPIDCLPHV